MRRRQFIKNSVGGVVIPAVLSGFGTKAFGMDSPLFDGIEALNDNVLVIIELNGGNDGLHTLVPLDQYANLANNRQNIILPQNSLLPLTGQSLNALHPAMTGMQQLFNDGKLLAIQSVAYPDQNLSHFRSSDIWMSASDEDQLVSTGWIGRYLNYEYPSFPTGYPNATMPDPLGLEISDSPSLAFMGPQIGMGVTVSDPSSFYNFVQGIQTPTPNTPAGRQLAYVRNIASHSLSYGNAVLNAYNRVSTQNPYPQNSQLAEKLKIVARLIAGGLKTKVFMVTLKGFDTHAGQVDGGNTVLGEHANLLKQVSDAIKAFMDDCAFLGISQRVLGMTVSEFGRRIISNGSTGTDHGVAAPMFLFGDNVLPGILGSNPVIPANATPDDNIQMQYDFRSVYSSILKDWFCVPQADLPNIMLQPFPTLPVVNAAH